MEKDTSKLVTIPGELHSAATGNIVAGADEIFDYDSSCYQSDINSRWTYEENPEFVEVHVDASSRILYGVRHDGDFHFGAGVPSQIEERVAQVEEQLGSEIADLENTIEVYVDASINELSGKIDAESERATEAERDINKKLNKLNIAIDPERGVFRICGKMFKMIEYTGEADFDEDIDYTVFVDAVTTIENPEWQKAITDSEDKVLYGEKQDGEVYWPMEELEGEMMSVETPDGTVTASVNSIVRNLK